MFPQLHNNSTTWLLKSKAGELACGIVTRGGEPHTLPRPLSANIYQRGEHGEHSWRRVVRTITQPIQIIEPPAEGDWQLSPAPAGDDDDGPNCD